MTCITATPRPTLPARAARALALAAVPAIVLALLAAPAAAQFNSVDATIRGVVIDETTGEGIPGVVVEVLDHVERIRRSTISDEDGRFMLLRVHPGVFWLRANHIAYTRTKTPQWRVGSGEILDVVIRLHSDVVLLAPLEVTARVQHFSPVLSGFYARLNRPMGGTLISREDIEARNPARVTDLLEGIPGVNIQASGQQQSFRVITMGRALPGAGGGPNSCPVQIFVDGVHASRGGSIVSPDEILAPGSLEGVEVYRGLSTIPAEFLTPESRCGVIAFWTRRGG